VHELNRQISAFATIGVLCNVDSGAIAIAFAHRARSIVDHCPLSIVNLSAAMFRSFLFTNIKKRIKYEVVDRLAWRVVRSFCMGCSKYTFENELHKALSQTELCAYDCHPTRSFFYLRAVVPKLFFVRGTLQGILSGQGIPARTAK